MADLDVLEKLLEQTEKPREQQLPVSNGNSNNHHDDRKSDHENGDDERGDKTYDIREDRYRSSKRSRSRSRTRSRSRDRRRRKYGRSRSRSRERRYHRYSSRDYDRRSSRNRSRSRDRYYRRRSRSRDRIEERRERDANDKKYNVDEHDRDLRTVFIRSLPTKADVRDIKRWFEKASAHVREVRLITDKYTKKSKGFGYVEFYQKESVEKALSLSGSQLLGKTVHVELSEAEKNIEASSDLRASTRIYISNLYYAVNEEMLRAVFEKFGDIEYLNLHFNAGTDATRGFAFVQYKKREAALKAISMNGAEIMNKAMKVGFVNSKKDMEMSGLNTNMLDSNLDLEDVDYISNHQKFELMHSLNNRDIDSYGAGNEQVKLTQKEEILSKCIVVENMFDPDNETDPNFDIDLANDVKMECTNKYGEIEDLYVDKKSKGNVYIRFKTVDFAKNAYLGLNGRWFDNKPLSVRYIPLEVFLETIKA